MRGLLKLGVKKVSLCICLTYKLELTISRRKEIQIYGKSHSFLFKTQVETEKDGIPMEHNTFTEFDVRSYNSPSRTFLYVRAIRVCFLKLLTLFSLERFEDIP